MIYDFARTHHIDGLLLHMSGLEGEISPEGMHTFVNHYQPRPMVSSAGPFQGIPCVNVGRRQGMCDIVNHLIDVHQCYRILFMRGPEVHSGAQQRYQGYCDALAQHGIAMDAHLVSPPIEHPSQETEAILTMLLDHRGLCPGIDFQAVAVSSDGMAKSVLHVLQERGIRVPDTVALVSYENTPDSNVTTPPLTTVQPPYYEKGRQSIDLLLSLLQGEGIPDEEIFLPSSVIVRQSCGCASSAIVQAAVEQRDDSAACHERILPGAQPEILAAMAAVVENSSSNDVLKWMSHLLESFLKEMHGEASGLMLQKLNDILRQVIAAEGDVTAWQNVLSAMRRHILPFLHDSQKALRRAENLWQQARVVIGQAVERRRLCQLLQERHQAQTLRNLEATLSTTFDVSELLDVLARELPLLGIPSAYLALYEDPSPHAFLQPAPMWSRLLLAYNEGGQLELDPEGRRFRSHQLVPEGLFPTTRRYTMVVQPLYFQDHQLGFLIFEVGPREGWIYEALRSQISTALHGALLVRQVRKHSDEIDQYRHHLEDLVEDRTAELRHTVTETNRLNARLQDEIAERTRAERSVRVSEQQYRLLAEHVMDGIVIVEGCRVVFTNAVFADMVGCAPEQLMHSDLLAVFHERTRRTAQAQLSCDSEDTLESRWQVEITHTDGRALWAEIVQVRIEWHNACAFLLTIRDITERKLRERRLEEERARLQQENITLKSTIAERYRFGQIIGKSRPMQHVYELLLSAATSDVNVLLCGESGTGKELIARTIHQISLRKAHPFVAVNCASIPDTLFEREFFGHRRGTFTGADRDKPGLFDRAHKGVLFLDEVTELKPGMQAKLLRVLQDGGYTPLGSTTPKQADTLIVAATNKDWKMLIEQGQLREDFFYRIGVIDIRIPPLRERKEDLPLLIDHILGQYRQKQERLHGRAPEDVLTDQAMLPGELMRALYTYHWPGNVRELQNVLQRYLATQRLDVVLPHFGISAQSRGMPDPINFNGQTLPEAVELLEKQIITDALLQNYYKTGQTARMLGINQRTLQRKIKQYQLKGSE